MTPIFLHFDALHILFNMLWLMDPGRMVERTKSSWFLLLFVLVVAILSNLTQYIVRQSGIRRMSGVIYALQLRMGSGQTGFELRSLRIADHDGVHADLARPRVHGRVRMANGPTPAGSWWGLHGARSRSVRRRRR